MIEIWCPLAGWAGPLSELPDPVFAERMLGDGIQIDPTEGLLIAPAAGVVEAIHASRHALTLATDAGPVLLLHVGLETVALGGRGFKPLVQAGDRVGVGQGLLRFDLDRLALHAKSLQTPIVVTNGERFRIVSRREGLLAAGDLLMELEPVAAANASAAPLAGPTAETTLALPLAHGLHARPAARIAAEAARFQAEMTIGAVGGAAVSARSPVAMLALGLDHGAQLHLQAHGPDAQAALDAVTALIVSGMGELKPTAEAPAPASDAPLPDTLHGASASPGRAIGPAFRFRRAEIAVREVAGTAEAERQALAAACAAAAAHPEAAGPGADIAAAHRAFLADPALQAAADAAIATGASAGVAWRRATDGFAAQLAAAGPRFAERIADLRDIERQVLLALAGGAADAPRPPAGAILLADGLGPSDLMALADAGLAGLATGDGGPTSHVAIIAQSIGLPMLAALGPHLAAVPDGRMLLLDASAGQLETAPGAQRLEQAQGEAAARAAAREAALAHAGEPAITLDGARIELFANVGSRAEAGIAAGQGAEGCGLLRTEFLFLDRAAPPSEAEQRDAVQAIADALPGKTLIVRTMDIGADKPAPWLNLAAEENPALGLRGIRLQLARRDLLESQLRALLAVQAPVQIMLPMVAELSELETVRVLLHDLAAKAGREPPPLGIMIETPAAALMSAVLAESADFFSIGSNDLSQYALAADRTNPAVAPLLDGVHPAVLRLIAATAEGAAARRRLVGLCGSLAADPLAVPLLIGLGVTELSVPPAAVAETKALVRKLGLAQCRALAARAMRAHNAAAVRAMVREELA